MKRLIFLFALLALPPFFAFSGKAGGQCSGVNRQPPHPDTGGRVIVVFKKGVSAACAASVVERHPMDILRRHEALYRYSGQVFFYLASDSLTSEEMVRLLEKDPRVHRVKEESALSILPDRHPPGTD